MKKQLTEKFIKMIDAFYKLFLNKKLNAITFQFYFYLVYNNIDHNLLSEITLIQIDCLFQYADNLEYQLQILN